MIKNQHGFGVVAVVVLALTAGVIGLVAWRIIASSSNYTETQARTPGQQERAPVSAAKVPSLDIKEWDVKIPLSRKAEGAYYTLNLGIQQSASSPEHLIVYSKDVDALIGPQGQSCKGEYIAYLIRLPKDDPRWQPKQNIDDGNVSSLFINRTDIGEFRYAVSTYKGYGPECFDTSNSSWYEAEATVSQKFREITQAFADDFKNIQAVR